MKMGPNFLCQKIASLVHAISIYLPPFFSFLSTRIFRQQRYSSSSLKKKDDQIIFFEKDAMEFRRFDVNKDEEEEEKKELSLKFKFPTFEEFSRRGNLFNSDVVPYTSTSKYEFSYGESSSVTAFIDKMETFQIKENISNRKNFEEIYNVDVKGKGKEIMGFDREENKESNVMNFKEESEEKLRLVQETEEYLDESAFCLEKSSLVIDSDDESTSFDHMHSFMNGLVDSYSDGFLSDGDFEGVDNEENDRMELESELSYDFDDEENDIVEELNNLEDYNLQNPKELHTDFLSENDFDEGLDNKNDIKCVTRDGMEVMNGGDNSEKSNESSMPDSGDGNKLESLWEHQDLIEQLKMELRKVRATGLPTILEESESPKITDDLKPWKIDEKFYHEDCFGELHKFYKSYRERMRKFDILNYQKMYAMGFLQLKDPLQSIANQKPVAPTLRSLVSQNMWLFKHKINGNDPMKKFVEELQGDLEVVYVGHMCLSWEFLHWQHEKALELWDSDPRAIHRYNEVAGEFQQFQVLMQRFIEDELFQGPRVQNYVKSRCVLRNLLQVPVIREDDVKYKRKAIKEVSEEYVISCDTLVEIVEESIRIFWRFIRADKDCSTTTAINSHKKTPELQNPEDLTLLIELKRTLHKKERKLKDLLRRENCILRKFQQCREDDTDQVLYFFSQVDMKLVSRVLNMSKITRDQLIWCQNKLNKIRFVNKKIYIEPTFLLFPY